MSNLLAGLLSALLVTNQPVTLSNVTTVSASPQSNDSTEKEFQQLLALDDNTQERVDQLIRDNEAFAAKGAPAPEGELREQIDKHFAPVRKAYEDFLKAHPDHVRARLAFGSFLNDIKLEDAARDQFEKARELDPKNPAAWNNLANYYGHNGPVTNAFVYYAKAIELNPAEPTYYHNYGTTVYLFRKDAMEHFKITEQEVFDKALALYGQALRLDPENFLLASDIAQTFYGITPLRTNTALMAWYYALQLARDDIEREGVFVHLARVKMNAGRFDDARRDLDRVTNAMYADLKKRVQRSLEYREEEAKSQRTPATDSSATRTNTAPKP